MTKARAFTIAGLIHFTMAALLAMTVLASQPGTALGSGMVITRTATPTLTTLTPNGNNHHKQCRLTCTKTADPAEVLPGDLVTLAIEVCNKGDRDCDAQPDIQMHKGVVVSDDLPDELLEVVSASASLGHEFVVGNDVRAEFGVLLPGTCAKLTIVAQVRDDVKLCTQFTNVATIGDDVKCSATLIVPCLPDGGENAPQISELAPQAVVVGLLMMGVGLLAAGMVLRTRSRVS